MECIGHTELSRVLQAHRQAQLKNNSIFRHHSKSSLLAPEIPPMFLDVTQPAHHVLGITQCDLNKSDLNNMHPFMVSR